MHRHRQRLAERTGGHRQPLGQLVHGLRGHHQLVGQAAVDRGADAQPVGAAVVLALEAVLAVPAAVGVGLDRHAVADRQVRRDVRGDRADRPGHLVPERARHLHAVAPGDGAAVGPADRDRVDVDEDLARGELRGRDLLDGDVAGAGSELHQCAHRTEDYRLTCRLHQTCTYTSIAQSGARPAHSVRRRSGVTQDNLDARSRGRRHARRVHPRVGRGDVRGQGRDLRSAGQRAQPGCPQRSHHQPGAAPGRGGHAGGVGRRDRGDQPRAGQQLRPRGPDPRHQRHRPGRRQLADRPRRQAAGPRDPVDRRPGRRDRRHLEHRRVDHPPVRRQRLRPVRRHDVGGAALAAGEPARAARRRDQPVVQGLGRVQPDRRRLDRPVGRQPGRDRRPEPPLLRQGLRGLRHQRADPGGPAPAAQPHGAVRQRHPARRARHRPARGHAGVQGPDGHHRVVAGCRRGPARRLHGRRRHGRHRHGGDERPRAPGSSRRTWAGSSRTARTPGSGRWA